MDRDGFWGARPWPLSMRRQGLSPAREPLSSVTGKSRLLPGIHGLRCAAAFGILIFHLKGLALVPPPHFLLWLTDEFAKSVKLFFLLSAFSLMYSTIPTMASGRWIESYAIRRFFRIAPVFYFMLIFTVIWQAYFVHTKIDPMEVVLNVTLMFGFVSDRATSLVLGGWTIGAEVVFYALFPMVLGVIRGLRTALVFTAFAVIVGTASLELTLSEGQPWWLYAMSFPAQLQYFAGGVAAYFLYLKCSSDFIDKRIPHFVVGCLFLAALIVAFGGIIGGVVAIILFAALTIWQARRPSRLLSSRFAVYWGERSYGIYLIHMPLMVIFRPLFAWIVETTGEGIGYFVCLVLALAATLLLADLVYHLIERPGIRLGHRIAGRVQAGNQPA